ncbi:MAG TPA: hypothetical protein VF041_02480 [Gemmatimonadaceae bacterium]
MTMPFVATVRARQKTITLGGDSAARMLVRVEVPERWDVVRVAAPPSESVLAVKVAALQVLDPRADQRDYVMKLRGYEVLDEGLSLAMAGVTENAIFLLTRRRRRPVR